MAPKTELIVKWLSHLDFEATQTRTLAERVDGTSDWILSHETFTAWLAGRTRSPVVWAHGLPSTGKTMCTAIAVDHLRRNVAGPQVAVAVAYCDYYNNELTALNLLSSWCAQLAAQVVGDLPPLLVKLYAERDGEERLDIDEVTLVL